ncbi:hypothetical protein EDB81DRAFT_449727 [Dactylonectria macrodidyma]|uniref:Uncharacterized protein n=1 Tax=Dactylonectria macrodidyma TaxID=307937 RepID=A0A9P9F598_9HYPO|nr:hypothetical protein EDB81DRAFT_449727 [Dactylonectria macrodidyma]
MALEHIPGTASYLTNAAHLLRMTAPGASAHLMSHRNQLLDEHWVHRSETQLQHACGGCGIISITSWGNMKTERPQHSRRKAKSLASRSTGAGSNSGSTEASKTTNRHRTMHCVRCQRVTTITLTPPGRAVRLKAKKLTTIRKPATQDTPKPTANSSSKKRAKNRKAGLQALLTGQQQAANPLSLSHFMK